MGLFKGLLVNIGSIVQVTSKIDPSPIVEIPGITTASVYVAEDAFGEDFFIPVPKEGTISNVIFYDLDDEGINKELVIATTRFTKTADHDVFDISDIDLVKVIGIAYISTFSNFNSNQIGLAIPALSYATTTKVDGKFGLWCQLITKGTDNIAAGSIPKIGLVVV